MLDQTIKDSIKESVLCWLATANAAGEPNVSPKEMFLLDDDDNLLIANIASPNSVKNVESNPAVCVSFIDIFKQKGHKLKGQAKILKPLKPEYAAKANLFRPFVGDKFPIRSIIEVKITAVSQIIAPSYWLFPDTTEQNQIAQAMKTYGVTPNT